MLTILVLTATTGCLSKSNESLSDDQLLAIEFWTNYVAGNEKNVKAVAFNKDAIPALPMNLADSPSISTLKEDYDKENKLFVRTIIDYPNGAQIEANTYIINDNISGRKIDIEYSLGSVPFMNILATRRSHQNNLNAIIETFPDLAVPNGEIEYVSEIEFIDKVFNDMLVETKQTYFPKN